MSEEGDLGVNGIAVLNFFFVRCFGNFDFNVRYCGFVDPCGIRFFAVSVDGIR